MMNILDRLKKSFAAIVKPTTHEKNLTFVEALKLYYETAIIPFIAFVVIGALLLYLNGGWISFGLMNFITPYYVFAMSMSPYASLVLSGIVLLFIVIPLGALLDAVAYHIVGRIFLQVWRGDFSKTLTALVYSTFPLVLFSWLLAIPVISNIYLFIAAIWEFVVLVIALSVQHKVTRLNALLTVFASAILFVGLMVLAGVMLRGFLF